MSITDFQGIFTVFWLRPRFLLRLLFVSFRASFSSRYNLAIFAQYNRHGISASSLCFFEVALTPLWYWSWYLFNCPSILVSEGSGVLGVLSGSLVDAVDLSILRQSHNRARASLLAIPSHLSRVSPGRVDSAFVSLASCPCCIKRSSAGRFRFVCCQGTVSTWVKLLGRRILPSQI